MSLKRVATYKPGKSQIALVLDLGDRQVAITYAQKATMLDTEGKMQAVLQQGTELPIFIHFNQDGSVSMATGQAPDVWPEDVKDI